MLTHAKAITFVLTPDHNRAAAWYRDVLGLTHVSTDAFAATFDLAGTTLRLTTVPGWTAGAHTVLGWAVPDLRAAMASLKAKGIEFLVYPGFGQDADGVWSAPDRAVKLCWFNDPDGNNLSLTEGA
ncbi:VOC family protein [Hyphomonas sp.]|uniref:VOC family protein n=1 Tax=Hyphomonas sp. TaxID=87 RepID=UPI00391BDD79